MSLSSFHKIVFIMVHQKEDVQQKKNEIIKSEISITLKIVTLFNRIEKNAQIGRKQQEKMKMKKFRNYYFELFDQK